MKPNPRISLVLACILVVGFSLRAYKVSTEGEWHNDGLLYYELARGFFFDGKVLIGKSVRTIVTRGNLEFYDNMFLQGKFGQIFLIAISFLLGGIRLESAFYLQMLLGTGTVYLIYLLGERIFDRQTGLAAAALAALSLTLVNYSRTALTPAGEMFFFTLGLYVFFGALMKPGAQSPDEPPRKSGEKFVHPLFLAGICVGYAFTIHYNLAWYFLTLYFSHLGRCFLAREKRQAFQENLLLAAGLAAPLIVFEFGYPLVYYIIYKKHVLYSYFQEVLFNALEAGGGSRLWNYFPIFLWFGENPAYCVLIGGGGLLTMYHALRQRDHNRGLFPLVAFFPPILLSAMNFPLVGRNLSPSLPLFAIAAAWPLGRIAALAGERWRDWVAAALACAVMLPGLPQLGNLYQIQSPYFEIREDVKNKKLLLLAGEEYYRNAILYKVNPEISVVPLPESILKDQYSRVYYLLTQASTKLPEPFRCSPLKTYSAFNTSRFAPIRYEDDIPDEAKEPAEKTELFALYDLEQCLGQFPFPEPPRMGNAKPVTEIGQAYSIRKVGMTSPGRIFFQAGMDYLNGGYMDEAIFEFQHAIQSNPNLVHAHNNLALALVNKQRFPEALASLNKAESLSAGLQATQNLFGLTYLSMGDPDRAIEYFKKSIRIDPSTPTPYQYLAGIYANIKGDPAQAQIYAQQLQSIGKK